MKTITIYLFFILLFIGTNSIAQIPIPGSPSAWLSQNCRTEFSGDTIHLVNTSGTTGFLWATGISLKNGIIELDIKGKDTRGESFVGVIFHALDEETYDAVYFRPFNFRDVEREDRSVQYVAKPDYDWDILREKHPGRYEHAIVPDTDPNDWFHAKIVIQHPVIRVFINGSAMPTLEVTQLSQRKGGRLGLWVDSPDGRFRNVTIKHTR